MEVKDRVAARRAAALREKAAGTAAPVSEHLASAAAGGSATAASSTSRAARFKGRGVDEDLERAQFGNEDAESDGSAFVARSVASVARPQEQGSDNVVDGPASSVATSVASVAASVAGARPSRAQRFSGPSSATTTPGVARPGVQRQPSSGPEGSRPVSSTPIDPQRWDDPNRPAGTGYPEEEWLAAEAAHPGCVVYEILKPAERGLVAMPSVATDPLLKRSLVILESVDTPWKGNATARIEHHGELGVFSYLVVRCEAERQKNSWADGSKMIIRDGPPQEEQAPIERSRADRYRAG